MEQIYKNFIHKNNPFLLVIHSVSKKNCTQSSILNFTYNVEMFFLYYCVSTYIILYICLLCGTMKNVGISPPGLQRSTLLAPSLYCGCSPACSLLGRFVLHCPPNMSLSSWDPQSAFHKVNIKVFNCEIQDILFLKTIFIYVLKKPKGGRR